VRDFIQVSVEYSEGIREVEVPDDYLMPLISKLRQALELAGDFENRYSYGMDICSIEPDVRELRSWDRECAVFRRLRVWALGNLGVTKASEFASELLEIDDDAFWPFKGNRDLLLGLSKRWNEFSQEGRIALAKRISKGPRKMRGESKEKHSERSAFQTLNRLHWLADQGCAFHFDLANMTAKLQARAPDWKAEYSKQAAKAHDGGGGAIRVDTRFDSLQGLACFIHETSFDTEINANPESFLTSRS
jgi:hypothetical protein